LIHVCKVPASIAPLPGVSPLIWVEVMTLAVSGQGVQAPLELVNDIICGIPEAASL